MWLKKNKHTKKMQDKKMDEAEVKERRKLAKRHKNMLSTLPQIFIIT